MQIKLALPSSHSMLTPGQPVPALTLERQAQVATTIPVFNSVVTRPGKSPTDKAGFHPKPVALREDASPRTMLGSIPNLSLSRRTPYHEQSWVPSQICHSQGGRLTTNKAGFNPKSVTPREDASPRTKLGSIPHLPLSRWTPHHGQSWVPSHICRS